MKRNRYSSSSVSDSEAQESNWPKRKLHRKPDPKNAHIEEMPQMDDPENLCGETKKWGTFNYV